MAGITADISIQSSHVLWFPAGGHDFGGSIGYSGESSWLIIENALALS